jgi:UDP-glucose 4-epimerase
MSTSKIYKDLENQQILVTGGAGYIGSHTVVKLLEAGAIVVILDNLSNSKRDVINRIEKITGKRPDFLEGDIRNRSFLRAVFKKYQINSVVHFAGLKAVGESIQKPLEYYVNNVMGSLLLFEEMTSAGVQNLIFSSSATVYGNPTSVPITENFPLKTTNPYGQSKLMVENVLRDLYKSSSFSSIALLRYFNPVGAHETGLIGEDPSCVPNNLMPLIGQVALGKRERLIVFGNDYPTPDGTGVRDYIHVDDLAAGHLATLGALRKPGLLTINLGTGQGYSVLQMIKAFEEASGQRIPFDNAARRPGDIATSYADTALAKSLLGWKARHGIQRMCQDTWRWQSKIYLDLV